MGKMKSTFKELASIDIRDKVQKKTQFDYLSWAYAWAIVKDKYPDSVRTVYESEHTGLNYFTDGKTGYVKVGVTINGLEHIDYLPIYTNKNESLTIDRISSKHVQKAIQRSTVKAIAMHGLGLSLWAGEDLVDVSEKVIEPVVIEKIEDAYIYGSAKFQNTLDVYRKNLGHSVEAVLKSVKNKHNPDPKTLQKLKEELNKIKDEQEKTKGNTKSVKQTRK
jgi:hypothetical protein|tara:strand:- start:111 stop:770 length:660 start_codon:yes stop_codon:yes gene_type:complete